MPSTAAVCETIDCQIDALIRLFGGRIGEVPSFGGIPRQLQEYGLLTDKITLLFSL